VHFIFQSRASVVRIHPGSPDLKGTISGQAMQAYFQSVLDIANSSYNMMLSMNAAAATEYTFQEFCHQFSVIRAGAGGDSAAGNDAVLESILDEVHESYHGLF
jgi:hypothetical protein